MADSTFVYATYIKTTPEKLWEALTNCEFMKQYWFGTSCESDWKAGSSWKMVARDGQITDAGEIIESVPPKRLVIKWRHELMPELKEEGYSRCVFDIEPAGNAVKLTITHGIGREGSKVIAAVSGGWPKILSNLKSLIETGQVVLEKNEGCKAEAALKA
ncbi:MAG: SRPBCC family protein [Alphaproteobacteria bacterium]|nr:SRPBCC family protein [Alphaproteobacteria bacterium]